MNEARSPNTKYLQEADGVSQVTGSKGNDGLEPIIDSSNEHNNTTADELPAELDYNAQAP